MFSSRRNQKSKYVISNNKKHATTLLSTYEEMENNFCGRVPDN